MLSCELPLSMIGFPVLYKSLLSGAFLVGTTLYCYDIKRDVMIPNSISNKIIDNDYGMTVEEFQKKIAVSKKTILVYFHAEWCGPCAKLKPGIAELENETKEFCEVIKIDTDANPKIAEFFEINSLPMFVIYKDGKKSWENVGLLTKEQIKAKVELYKK